MWKPFGATKDVFVVFREIRNIFAKFYERVSWCDKIIRTKKPWNNYLENSGICGKKLVPIQIHKTKLKNILNANAR